MRIKLKNIPAIGDIRTRTIFCWFPTIFKFPGMVERELIWLETVEITEQYIDERINEICNREWLNTLQNILKNVNPTDCQIELKEEVSKFLWKIHNILNEKVELFDKLTGSSNRFGEITKNVWKINETLKYIYDLEFVIDAKERIYLYLNSQEYKDFKFYDKKHIANLKQLSRNERNFIGMFVLALLLMVGYACSEECIRVDNKFLTESKKITNVNSEIELIEKAEHNRISEFRKAHGIFNRNGTIFMTQRGILFSWSEDTKTWQNASVIYQKIKNGRNNSTNSKLCYDIVSVFENRF